MTVLDHRPTDPVPGWLPGATAPRTDPAPLLPDAAPVRVLGAADLAKYDPALLLDLYRRLVAGRRYNQQATTLTKQGRLAVYPSSTGQEACQVAAATVLAEDDWLFPSYRDTLAVVGRGVDPLEALTLLRGNAHTGYDPKATRTAPLCTPLATQAPHAVGLAHAARLAGDPTVALALLGDGGTSEGDFHEALNFAAVLNAPVVFLVQNNGYAISVPLTQQSAAPTLAHKAVGYGMRGRLVDGNDVVAVHEVLAEAVDRARAGGGPTLVEALTYRLEAHTNADDATRYRQDAEVTAWQEHDPLLLMERQLRAAGLLDDAAVARATEEAEALAARMRTEFHAEPQLDPFSLFQHVYAEPTSQLLEQQAQLAAELAAEDER
ncbi:pyruvate dehydrogenase (acetyl-transferring) E1 component subunit alpha [Kitasatospora viridis]|uniref:Pyruvate dehydrogenase E1 component alpha subunit n=1 Tax=Kitasatospora viridis TaxID=281105 RepID=A0A561UHC3_9ACTN|nr:pyruvate dehydrogenase (acetyl-transferring) E1 component subunit alpha [Kitasatospora viridis]TWF98745.1 pyruvate dehydrogenase E1 component alpha subunit [Kitasatospora viridis]